MRMLMIVLVLGVSVTASVGQDKPAVFPGTQPLTADRPLDVLMVEGIDRFCLNAIAEARAQRESLWKRDVTDAARYEQSLAPYRARLGRILGVVDARTVGPQFDPIPTGPGSAPGVERIRWSVLPGLTAEGLRLKPEGVPRASVIALPDAQWSPEQFCAGRDSLPQQLVQRGCQVIVLTLFSRDDEFSGNPEIAMTNQSHREWVYRSAFEVGRHVLGYEIQKVLAAVDLLKQEKLPVAIAGIGDGGLLALASGALDPRVDAVLVSGYFQPRDGVWQEPIDRNVWGLLKEFGDAQLAGMVAPRPLVIEACSVPETVTPLPIKPGRRGGAAPGRIGTAALAAVQSEFQLAQSLYVALQAGDKVQLVTSGPDGQGPGASEAAVQALAKGLGPQLSTVRPAAAFAVGPAIDPTPVQQRQVNEAIEFTQRTLRHSYKTRDKLFGQADRSSLDKYVTTSEALRKHVYDELIGRLPDPTLPANPRTRKVLDEKEYTGYEVVLDVYPDVIAAGILLWPTDLKPGERRPVVVCQHGLEGVPMDTISGPGSPGYPPYKAFSAELARRGFIVYAPQNPYRGRDLFRTLQRKSNPLGRSLFSYIIPQHLVTLRWLSSLPNVDADRLAFYGLSYGGKTAVRVPPLLPPRAGEPGYCLSICSADFNEWVTKNASTDLPFSYVFTGEYEIFEWDMAHVANYAELSFLMTPRPFMVERGHDDGVGLDEWVAFEYAKVRRHYTKLGIGDRTEIEFFNGPHSINGQGTYDFLHRHLKWPRRS